MVNFIINFIFIGLLETYVMFKFYKTFYNTKIHMALVLPVAFISSLVVTLLTQSSIKQVVGIFILTIVLKLFSNVKILKCIWMAITSFTFLLVTESVILMLLDFSEIKIDMTNKMTVVIIITIIRIIELFILKIYMKARNKTMGLWWFGETEEVNEEVETNVEE